MIEHMATNVERLRIPRKFQVVVDSYELVDGPTRKMVQNAKNPRWVVQKQTVAEQELRHVADHSRQTGR